MAPPAGYDDRLRELLVRSEQARRRAQAALDTAQVTMQRAADRRVVPQALRGPVSPATSSATHAGTAEQALINAEVEQSAIGPGGRAQPGRDAPGRLRHPGGDGDLVQAAPGAGAGCVVDLTEDFVRQLAPLAGVVLAHEDLQGALVEITRVSARLVPGADGVSITTFQDGRPVAVAFSDEWAKELDELQFEEREGPCLDSIRTGNIFRVRDVTADTRWPAYTERAGKLGALSLVSIPLQAEGRVFGALDVYSRTPDAFTSETVALAEIIAGHAGLASQVAAVFFRHRDLAEQMREAMNSRAVIEQAKGVLMAQRKVTADAAFDLLRQVSQRANVKVRLVAQAVLDTGTLPGDEEAPSDQPVP